MKRKKAVLKEAGEARYYDKHGVLKEIIDEPVEMSLRTELRRSIILGKRRRKLKILLAARNQIQSTGGIPHREFWKEMEKKASMGRKKRISGMKAA